MMRLLSQDGTSDVPYTGTTLQIEGDQNSDIWTIIAYPAKINKSVAMGEYDTIGDAMIALSNVYRAAARGKKHYIFPKKEEVNNEH